MEPNLLVDKEFNIPVFNAQKQRYKCIGVEVEYPGNGRTYKISFTEIKELGYNVPDKLELVLGISVMHDRIAKVRLNEIELSGKPRRLNEMDIATKKINSLSGLKAVLKVLAEEM